MSKVKFISGYAAVAKGDHSLAKGETNDCVVRAIMNATECSYDEAHRFTATRFGRKPKNGTRGFANTMCAISRGAEDFLGRQLKFLGRHPEMVGANKAKPEQAESLDILINPKYPKGGGHFAGYTVGKFYQQHQTGTYIIQVRGHALCIRDGVIYENPTEHDRLLQVAGRDQRKVQYVWQVK